MQSNRTYQTGFKFALVVVCLIGKSNGDPKKSSCCFKKE